MAVSSTTASGWVRKPAPRPPGGGALVTVATTQPLAGRRGPSLGLSWMERKRDLDWLELPSPFGAPCCSGCPSQWTAARPQACPGGTCPAPRGTRGQAGWGAEHTRPTAGRDVMSGGA